MPSRSRLRALLAIVLGCLSLSACRVDTVVSLNVDPDGSGVLAVVATADAEVMASAPNLVDDLNFDAAKEAGWKVSDVETLDSGSAQVRVSHSFTTPEEATQLMAQLSGEFGPFKDLALARSGKETDSTWALTGTAQITGGLRAFGDSALLDLIGGAPYEAAVREQNLDIGQAASMAFKVRLPGVIESTTGVDDAGLIQWTVPFDGSSQQIAATTQNTAVAATVARIFSPVLFWLFIAWLVVMAGFSGFVAFSRLRKRK
jgi:hypothetical protein